VLSSVADDVLDENACSLPNDIVTQRLDEILVALIALRNEDTHGTGLMAELADGFDVQPSPGTIYPRLHDLDANGTLTRHDLVQTKQYAIGDPDAADELLERAMQQHLALGLFLQAARDAV
jgi:DNA-binding PadR family transcriptional regulator